MNIKLLNQVFRLTGLMLVISVLGACSIFNHYFPDKSLAYQQYEAETTLSMPEGIQTDRIRDAMPVPDISPELKSMPFPEEVSRPAPLNMGLMNLGVQKRSAGELQWLFIDRSPSEVWPELVSWFEKDPLHIQYANPRNGTIESKAYLNDKTGKQQRLQAALQPGLQRNTSRLNLIVTEKMDAWPEHSENLALESELLDELSIYLGKELEKNKSVSLLAQELQRQMDVELFSENVEQPYLLINQDFNQSWYILGIAIRKSGMPLFDINRSLGLYYLSTDHEEAGRYVFTRKIKSNDSLSKLKKHGDFMIYVLETDDGSEITVKIGDDRNADPEFSIFVLQALLENLNSISKEI